jgi:hypothetical protein
MAPIEDFIKENRNAFDEYRLSAGHEERFKAKLQKKHNQIQLKSFVYAAATIAVILALTGVLGVYYNYFNGSEMAKYFRNSSNNQLYEVEAYYRSQLLRKYRAIEKIASVDNEMLPSPEQLFGETITDKPDVKAELENNPRKDEVVAAIVQSYQIRLENMERIEKELVESLKAEKQ